MPLFGSVLREEEEVSENENNSRNRFILSEIFKQASDEGGSESKDYPERRRDPKEIVKGNSQEFIYVRYLVTNSCVIEHPIPKTKFLEFEKAIAQSGQMSIIDILTKFKFRISDQVPLLALITQSGYEVNGQMVSTKIKKVG